MVSYSEPVYDDKYINTKLKTFHGVVNTIFPDNKIPKGNIHYICIAAINIDSIMKIDKKISSSLSRTMQLYNKKAKGSQIY